MTPPTRHGVRPASPARPRARSPRARRVPGRGRGHHRSRHGRRRRAASACRSRRRDHPARARPPRRLRADRRARRLQPGAGRWRGAEKPRGASPLGRRPPGPRGARRHRGRRDPPPGALPRRRPGGRGAHRVDRLGPRHAGGRWRRGGARALAARGPTLPRHARRARRPRRRPHPPHRRERLRRGPSRSRRRGRQREWPHDAAARRGRGARGPPRGLPPLPDPRRQPVREARAAQRRRRRARERRAGRGPDGALGLPPAAPHRAAGRARHRARRRAAHPGLRPPMRIRTTVALALALAASAPAAEEATVALNFQDVELPVLARFVSEVTGRNFIVDDRVRGKVTIISPTRITPDEAYLVFQSVLQVKGFTTVPSGAFTKIVPAREAVASGARRGDEVVTRILPLGHAEASGLVPVLQPLVSKDGLLTAYPPTNSLVVVDAGGNVERLGGLVADLDVPSSERATEVVTLRFAPADETARRLRDALGGQALRVTADARTNALVPSGPPDEVRRARAVAARLDQALPPGSTRVNVYRLRYAAADGLVRVLAQLVGQKLGPPPPPEPHGSSLARSAARRAEALGLGYDGGMGQPPPAMPVSAEAEPAAPGTPAAIPLAAPVRLTADPATNSLIVSATPADWETLRGVIEQLDVRRRQVFVEAIILEATAEKTRALGVEFQGGAKLGGERGLAQANLGTLAGALADPTSLPGLILAAASNQKVKLPNGQEVPAHTVLLTALQTDSDVNGGLLADTIRAHAEAVPFLGHIPVLGHLFRRDDDRRTKTNLLVFLTPHIIATDEQMATNSLRERERMRAALPRPRRDRPPLTGPSWPAPEAKP